MATNGPMVSHAGHCCTSIEVVAAGVQAARDMDEAAVMPKLQPSRDYDGEKKGLFADQCDTSHHLGQEPVVSYVMCGIQPPCHRCTEVTIRSYDGDMGSCGVCKKYCLISCGNVTKQVVLTPARVVKKGTTAQAQTYEENGFEDEGLGERCLGSADSTPWTPHVCVTSAEVIDESIQPQSTAACATMSLAIKAAELTPARHGCRGTQHEQRQSSVYMKVTRSNCREQQQESLHQHSSAESWIRVAEMKRMLSDGDDALSSGVEAWGCSLQLRTAQEQQQRKRVRCHYAPSPANLLAGRWTALAMSTPMLSSASSLSCDASAAVSALASPSPPKGADRKRGWFVFKHGPPPRGQRLRPRLSRTHSKPDCNGGNVGSRSADVAEGYC